MSADLGSLFKKARQELEVPSVPLSAICEAAFQRRPSVAGKRRRGLLAALWAFGSVAAVAAAAEIWHAAHFSYDRRGTMEIRSPELIAKRNPTTNDLARAARSANFHVVFPAGLPAGTKLESLGYGRGVIFLQYGLPGAWRRSDHIVTMVLTSSETLATKVKNHPGEFVLAFRGLNAHSPQWSVASERIIVSQSTLTPKELAAIESATLARARSQKPSR